MTCRARLGGVALVLALAACTGDRPAPAPTPTAASPTPSATAAAPTVAPAGVIPVLLVHGYGGSSREMRRLAGALRTAGHVVVPIDLPDGGRGDIAKSVAALVRADTATRAAIVAVVGFSLGGLVARAWAAGPGYNRARYVVSLGSPHHGVDLGAGCSGSCAQMKPDSVFLTELNRGDESPGGTEFVTIASDNDAVVEMTSAVLEGAVNVRVQAVCPGARIGHGGLALDPLPVALVLRALAGRLHAVPPSTECTALRREGAVPSA